MKKMSLLVLVLLAGLPGCGKKQESARSKKESVAQYMDVVDESGIEEMNDIDMDEDIASFDFGDEYGGVTVGEFEEELTPEDIEAIEREMAAEEGEDEFAWIDAQEDDEFKKLYFSFNHYGVREDQKAALNYDIEQVKELVAEDAAHSTVVIEGHACQEGDRGYNLALSEKRAKAIADLFVAAGVDRTAIKVVGRGQECPVVNGSSREERAPNRRVEVRVIYT